MSSEPIPSRTELRAPCGGSLVHGFWLLRECEHDPRDYGALLARGDAPLRLSEDLVMQLSDSLRWVPTLNPAIDLAQGHGLHHYGVTVIRGEGAAKLERICSAWAQLFENGPDVLELSDGVSEVRGDDGRTVEYVVAVLEVGRDDFVRDLRQLASFAARAATADHYILHSGL